MHLVPAYIPDADYIEQNDTPYGDAEQVAS